jgi:hypothetical protein
MQQWSIGKKCRPNPICVYHPQRPGGVTPGSAWAGRACPALHGSAELDLVGDHFARGALGSVLFIFRVVQVADDGQLLALLDMIGDGCGEAVEAGDAVPFGRLFGVAVFTDDGLAFGALVAARGQAEGGDGAALRGGFADAA